MFFSQKRFICFRETVCIGILICMFPLYVNAEDKNDFGDYPEGFYTWQKQARPSVQKPFTPRRGVRIILNTNGATRAIDSIRI